MFIDTHAHIGCKEIKDDIETLLQRAKEANLGAIINVSCAEHEQVDNIKWTDVYSSPDFPLYNTLGYHPDTFSDTNETDPLLHVSQLLEKLQHNFETYSSKIVAIGECGLDYFRTYNREAQLALFKGHIKYADKIHKPLIIHLRGDVYDDFFEILALYPHMKGVIHCFGGTREQAIKILKYPNMMISFTGVITFKNALESYAEITSAIPLERIMIETDSPYLAPVPHRGKQNEPCFVIEVAKQLAKNKGVDLEVVERVTTGNAKRFFGI